MPRCTSRELRRLTSISLSPIYAHVSETLSGQSTIRAMSATKRFQRDNMKYIDANLRANLAMSAASQWLNLRLQTIGVVIVTSVALFAVIQDSFYGINPSLVGLALTYALSLTSLLNGSITAFTETEKESVSVERVEHYIKEIKTECEHGAEVPIGWPPNGSIEFHNVSLRYGPSCPYALRDINLRIEPGEKIGIVGRTGSGKSSLLRVLFRMVDGYEGFVTLDDIPTTAVRVGALRSSLTIIPQDPFLFSGSIRDNLDPYSSSANHSIWKALRDCQMARKIAHLGGLDTEIEEQGQNFSVGERQLLCLARTLLNKSKVLCMDEATASMDPSTDCLIRHTVRSAFPNSTVIVIAHRIETVLDCDRVIVMKDGCIAEIGQPSTLLSDEMSEFHRLLYAKDG